MVGVPRLREQPSLVVVRPADEQHAPVGLRVFLVLLLAVVAEDHVLAEDRRAARAAPLDHLVRQAVEVVICVRRQHVIGRTF